MTNNTLEVHPDSSITQGAPIAPVEVLVCEILRANHYRSFQGTDNK